jgi:hypothetical protein
LAFSVAAACGGGDDGGDGALHLAVTRSDSSCSARLVGEGKRLEMDFALDPSGLRVAGAGLAIELVDSDATAPAGSASLHGDALTLDRREGWTGLYGGVGYRLTDEAERLALRDRLQASALGVALNAFLPLHDFVRAHMAETRAAFTVAALAGGDALAEPSSWPSYRPAEAMPLGMDPGDEPGVGMTCDPTIRCPLNAPYCVNETEEARRGVCSRACSDADDCARVGFDGRCDLEVTHVPGVGTKVRMCSFACGNDTDCPGSSICSMAGRCVAEH